MVRAPSLRAAALASAVLLLALALAASMALVVITSRLHAVSRLMDQAAGSIHTAGRIERGLFEHAVASNLIVAHPEGPERDEAIRRRDALEAAIRALRSDARAFGSSNEELAVLDRLDESSERYFLERNLAIRSGLPLDEIVQITADELRTAMADIEELIDLNAEQARVSSERIAAFDKVANLAGIGIAAALVLGFFGVLLVGRSTVYRPLVELRRVIERFRAGDWSSRAAATGGVLELREVAVTLNEMADAIARQREGQLAFLAAVAHDLRTPLTAMKMSAGLLAPGRALPSEDVLRRRVGALAAQVDRLERMIADLLDATAIEAGHIDLRLEETDLVVLSRRAVDLYATLSADHEVVLQAPEGPVLVRCDPHRVGQVLDNLLSNAIKYSPDGGLVQLALEEEAGEVVLSVTDHGVGIPPEEHGRIFEPFRRASSAKPAIPGLGLGLSVIRRIVAAHDGRIDVESAPGRGSTFRVRLPRRGPGAEADAARVAGASAASPASKPTKSRSTAA